MSFTQSMVAKLSFDGKGFEAGMNKAVGVAKKTNARIGQEVSSQFKSLALQLIGASLITRMIGETIKWANDTTAIRKEYEKMGVVLEDEVVAQMVAAGQQFKRLGYEMKAALLPVIAGAATGTQAILDSLATASRYWRSFDIGGIAKDIATGNVTGAGSKVGTGMSLGNIAVAKHDQEVIARMTKATEAFQLLMGGPDITEKDSTTKTTKAKSLTAQAIQADALAKIGGTAAPGFDRAQKIRSEQLRILRDIEQNTDPQNPAKKGADIQL